MSSYEHSIPFQSWTVMSIQFPFSYKQLRAFNSLSVMSSYEHLIPFEFNLSRTWLTSKQNLRWSTETKYTKPLDHVMNGNEELLLLLFWIRIIISQIAQPIMCLKESQFSFHISQMGFNKPIHIFQYTNTSFLYHG